MPGVVLAGETASDPHTQAWTVLQGQRVGSPSPSAHPAGLTQVRAVVLQLLGELFQVGLS